MVVFCCFEPILEPEEELVQKELVVPSPENGQSAKSAAFPTKDAAQGKDDGEVVTGTCPESRGWTSILL